jgi:hypothetical protein
MLQFFPRELRPRIKETFNNTSIGIEENLENVLNLLHQYAAESPTPDPDYMGLIADLLAYTAYKEASPHNKDTRWKNTVTQLKEAVDDLDTKDKTAITTSALSKINEFTTTGKMSSRTRAFRVAASVIDILPDDEKHTAMNKALKNLVNARIEGAEKRIQRCDNQEKRDPNKKAFETTLLNMAEVLSKIIPGKSGQFARFTPDPDLEQDFIRLIDSAHHLYTVCKKEFPRIRYINATLDTPPAIQKLSKVFCALCHANQITYRDDILTSDGYVRYNSTAYNSSSVKPSALAA